MPLFRTDTGCRCRKTFVSITTTRLRRSRGAGWRKMLFQTCELRMKSPTDTGGSLAGVTAACGLASRAKPQAARFDSHLGERLGVAAVAAFRLALLAVLPARRALA